MDFLIHGFPGAFLRPGGTVKLYFSVPVELHTVFSNLKHLAKTLEKNLAKNLTKNLAKIRAAVDCNDRPY